MQEFCRQRRIILNDTLLFHLFEYRFGGIPVAASEEIKEIYRSELNKLAQKYKLSGQDTDRICRVFNNMYDSNYEDASESDIYKKLKNEQL